MILNNKHVKQQQNNEKSQKQKGHIKVTPASQETPDMGTQLYTDTCCHRYVFNQDLRISSKSDPERRNWTEGNSVSYSLISSVIWLLVDSLGYIRHLVILFEDGFQTIRKPLGSISRE